MKKIKCSIALSLLAVAAGALSSCGDDHDIIFWSSFGSSYTNALNEIVEKTNEKLGINLGHVSKGSYDKVLSSMKSAIQAGTYPNIVTGYPDHFVEYIGTGVLVGLDKYVERYNAEFGTDLMGDYLADYMKENKDLTVDDDGNAVTSGLPFNKSTELMGYNGTFVDYCATLNPDLAKVPGTWQEWEVKGPKYREILNTLCGTGNHDGKCLYGRQDVEGNASDFKVDVRLGSKDADGHIIDADGRKLLLDLTEVNIAETRVISWDSTDNMFITLVRQWGAEYTRLTDTEKKKNPNERKGDIMFFSEENQPKVVDCLKFFKNLNKQGIFGVPQEFKLSYNSEAFEQNKVMFMLCSSGGLSYNTANWDNRFRVHALPYYDDGVEARKYVISQGADIALTNKVYFENKSVEEKDKSLYDCFKAMVAMTTGDLQADWCLKTGYYPCSDSATNAPKYQKFLKEAEPAGIQEYMSETGCSEAEAKAHAFESPTRVAYREGSNVNEEEYMKEGNGWNKFVDPAFIGSAKVRELSKTIFNKVFVELSDPSDADLVEVLREVVEHADIKQRATNIRVVY